MEKPSSMVNWRASIVASAHLPQPPPPVEPPGPPVSGCDCECEPDWKRVDSHVHIEPDGKVYAAALYRCSKCRGLTKVSKLE